MQQKISPIISPAELLALKKSNPVIVDARTGPDIKSRYADRHLQGAVHVDLDTDLATITPITSNGGRHPLPDPTKFASVLTRLGITPESHVIVYDDKNGANAAARFWWMLKSFGHKKVQVLDGGFDAAIKEAVPVSSGVEQPTTTKPYPVSNWSLPLSNIKEVEQFAKDDKFLVIDVRDTVRFNGEKEPIDLVAGHIPGATNIPFATNLDSNGYFLSPSQLNNKYTEALAGRDKEKVIVHCGSGVTACHTLLAMDYAGIDIPKLYVGSWSEWSTSNMPVATNKTDQKQNG
jgi:thiosulfate/3-mercaptopyruvate sulfurtransferase